MHTCSSGREVDFCCRNDLDVAQRLAPQSKRADGSAKTYDSKRTMPNRSGYCDKALGCSVRCRTRRRLRCLCSGNVANVPVSCGFVVLILYQVLIGHGNADREWPFIGDPLPHIADRSWMRSGAGVDAETGARSVRESGTCG
jgi:hypothetical protein